MRRRLFPVLVACSASLAGGCDAVRADDPSGAVRLTQPRGRTRIAGSRSLRREPDGAVAGPFPPGDVPRRGGPRGLAAPGNHSTR